MAKIDLTGIVSGDTFSCRFYGEACTGAIHISRDKSRAWLCQDLRDGDESPNRHGYKYSWTASIDRGHINPGSVITHFAFTSRGKVKVASIKTPKKEKEDAARLEEMLIRGRTELIKKRDELAELEARLAKAKDADIPTSFYSWGIRRDGTKIQVGIKGCTEVVLSKEALEGFLTVYDALSKRYTGVSLGLKLSEARDMGHKLHKHFSKIKK